MLFNYNDKKNIFLTFFLNKINKFTLQNKKIYHPKKINLKLKDKKIKTKISK